jgi:hypothetical protein
MSVLCHRCAASLSASDLFCPNCGSPQVRFEPREEGESAYASTRPTQLTAPSQGISWRDAITAALIVGIPAGVLSAISVLAWGCCLWVVGGAVLCIGLYRKRAPAFHLDTRSGLRIGALAGIIAAYASVAATAAWRAFARFVLHQGAAIDKFYDTFIQQSFNQQSALFVQSNAETQAQLKASLHFLLSPSGRAAYTLMYSAITASGIVLFSALGGVLGVRLYTGRKGPLPHS